MKNKIAFTLAEVLVTLSILGVVAAIMIPGTVQKIKDRQTVTEVKKVYSMLQNAIDIAIIENGQMASWAWPKKEDYNNAENAQYFASVLAKYLYVSRNCVNSVQGECRKDYTIKTLQGESHNHGYWINNYYNNVIVLKNGMTVTCFPRVMASDTAHPIISLRVDVNGSKNPNREGYDNFYFDFKSDGSFWNHSKDKVRCNATKAYSIADDLNSHSCWFWILKHNNMDYKYRDVSSEW